MGAGASVDLGSSTGNEFDYNIFYGSNIAAEPADPHKIILDPLLESPDQPGTGIDSLYGFRLKESSPAINSGMLVTGYPEQDFEGNPVPTYAVADRGAFEYTGPNNISDPASFYKIRIYPIPSKGDVNIEIDNFQCHNINIALYSLDNKLIFFKDYCVYGNSLSVVLPLKSLPLAPGAYLLKLNSGSQFNQESLIIFH